MFSMCWKNTLLFFTWWLHMFFKTIWKPHEYKDYISKNMALLF